MSDEGQIHVCVAGPTAVGKSSVCLMYTTHSFEAKHIPTSSAKKYYTRCQSATKDVLLYLEDTEPSDQIDHLSLLRSAVVTDGKQKKRKKRKSRKSAANGETSSLLDSDSRGREAFIVVFDVGSRKSYEDAQALVDSIHKRANYVPGDHRPCRIPVILIGNKAEMKKSDREVFDMEADNYTKTFEETGDGEKRFPSHMHYFDCSAKTGLGIKEAIEKAVDLAGTSPHKSKSAERECCGGCSVM